MEFKKLKKITFKLAKIINDNNSIDSDIIDPIIEADRELKQYFSKDSEAKYLDVLYKLKSEFVISGKVDTGNLEQAFNNLADDYDK